MARRRVRRARIWSVVTTLAMLVAGICILFSIQEKYGYDFGLPQLDIPAFSDILGEISAGPREASPPESQSGISASPHRDNLTVHYLDVGQGDSTLIVAPEKVVLIDAGENNQGENVLRYLRDQGIGAIDLLIGTHPHSDHIGGMDTVIYGIEVREVLLPEIPDEIIPTTVTYTSLLDAILEKDIPLTIASPGDIYQLGDGAALTILGPLREYSDLNNQSVIARVVYGGTSFLFTGDAEKAAETDLIESGALIRSDVLSAGHHGSRTASTQELLDAVTPQVAVISCGQDNKYGHPHREVVERLRDGGAVILRTDRDGAVTLISDGKTIGIEAEK